MPDFPILRPALVTVPNQGLNFAITGPEAPIGPPEPADLIVPETSSTRLQKQSLRARVIKPGHVLTARTANLTAQHRTLKDQATPSRTPEAHNDPLLSKGICKPGDVAHLVNLCNNMTNPRWRTLAEQNQHKSHELSADAEAYQAGLRGFTPVSFDHPLDRTKGHSDKIGLCIDPNPTNTMGASPDIVIHEWVHATPLENIPNDWRLPIPPIAFDPTIPASTLYKAVYENLMGDEEMAFHAQMDFLHDIEQHTLLSLSEMPAFAGHDQSLFASLREQYEASGKTAIRPWLNTHRGYYNYHYLAFVVAIQIKLGVAAFPDLNALSKQIGIVTRNGQLSLDKATLMQFYTAVLSPLIEKNWVSLGIIAAGLSKGDKSRLSNLARFFSNGLSEEQARDFLCNDLPVVIDWIGQLVFHDQPTTTTAHTRLLPEPGSPSLPPRPTSQIFIHVQAEEPDKSLANRAFLLGKWGEYISRVDWHNVKQTKEHWDVALAFAEVCDPTTSAAFYTHLMDTHQDENGDITPAQKLALGQSLFKSGYIAEGQRVIRQTFRDDCHRLLSRKSIGYDLLIFADLKGLVKEGHADLVTEYVIDLCNALRKRSQWESNRSTGIMAIVPDNADYFRAILSHVERLANATDGKSIKTPELSLALMDLGGFYIDYFQWFYSKNHVRICRLLGLTTVPDTSSVEELETTETRNAKEQEPHFRPITGDSGGILSNPCPFVASHQKAAREALLQWIHMALALSTHPLATPATTLSFANIPRTILADSPLIDIFRYKSQSSEIVFDHLVDRVLTAAPDAYGREQQSRYQKYLDQPDKNGPKQAPKWDYERSPLRAQIAGAIATQDLKSGDQARVQRGLSLMRALSNDSNPYQDFPHSGSAFHGLKRTVPLIEKSRLILKTLADWPMDEQTQQLHETIGALVAVKWKTKSDLIDLADLLVSGMQHAHRLAVPVVLELIKNIWQQAITPKHKDLANVSAWETKEISFARLEEQFRVLSSLDWTPDSPPQPCLTSLGKRLDADQISGHGYFTHEALNSLLAWFNSTPWGREVVKRQEAAVVGVAKHLIDRRMQSLGQRRDRWHELFFNQNMVTVINQLPVSATTHDELFYYLLTQAEPEQGVRLQADAGALWEAYKTLDQVWGRADLPRTRALYLRQSRDLVAKANMNPQDLKAKALANLLADKSPNLAAAPVFEPEQFDRLQSLMPDPKDCDVLAHLYPLGQRQTNKIDHMTATHDLAKLVGQRRFDPLDPVYQRIADYLECESQDLYDQFLGEHFRPRGRDKLYKMDSCQLPDSLLRTLSETHIDEPGLSPDDQKYFTELLLRANRKKAAAARLSLYKQVLTSRRQSLESRRLAFDMAVLSGRVTEKSASFIRNLCSRMPEIEASLFDLVAQLWNRPDTVEALTTLTAFAWQNLPRALAQLDNLKKAGPLLNETLLLQAIMDQGHDVLPWIMAQLVIDHQLDTTESSKARVKGWHKEIEAKFFAFMKTVEPAFEDVYRMQDYLKPHAIQKAQRFLTHCDPEQRNLLKHQFVNFWRAQAKARYQTSSEGVTLPKVFSDRDPLTRFMLTQLYLLLSEGEQQSLLQELNAPDCTPATALRVLLKKLGLDKMGQFLSVWPPIPEAIKRELRELQDNVPPSDQKAIETLLRQQFKGHPDIEALIKNLVYPPLGSGSVGEFYLTRLNDGTEVGLKVIPQGKEERFRKALDRLKELRFVLSLNKGNPDVPYAGMAERMIGMYINMVDRELDLTREAAQADLMLSQDIGDIRVPKYHPELRQPKSVVLEYIEGTPWKQAPENLRRAGIGVLNDSLLKQMGLGLGYHSDPQPGNLKFDNQGRLALLDWGQIGNLEPELASLLVQLMVMLLDKDASGITDFLAGQAEVAATGPLPNRQALTRTLVDFLKGVAPEQLTTSATISTILRLAEDHHMPLSMTVWQLVKTLAILESL